MAGGVGKKGKRKRTPKTSKGIHGGGGKVRLSTLQLILLGKGMAHEQRTAKRR